MGQAEGASTLSKFQKKFLPASRYEHILAYLENSDARRKSIFRERITLGKHSVSRKTYPRKTGYVYHIIQ